MIYLLQNSQEYNYDVRAILLAFFEREKIVEVSEQEYEKLLSDRQEKLQGSRAFAEGSDGSVEERQAGKRIVSYETAPEEREPVWVHLTYGDEQIDGLLEDAQGRQSKHHYDGEYRDHGSQRNAVCRFLYTLCSRYTARTLPWGTLTGIRPTKIIRSWMEDADHGTYDVLELERKFQDIYLADAQKAHLLTTVAETENHILHKKDYGKEYSLYIGIPFCPTTCLYCSFASYPAHRFGNQMEAYLDALFHEMAFVAEDNRDRNLSTVYIGGGTPTALNEMLLKRLMDEVHRLFPIKQVQEFTVEAGRPDSVTREKLEILQDAGVTRISINPQTMHQKTLDLIGRKHTVEQTEEAFFMARDLGFHNINMDIITGLPGERIEEVRETLERIRTLGPDNLTVHSLAIKRAAHLNMEMDKYGSLVWGSTNDMLRLVDDCAKDMNMNPYYMYRQKNIPGNLENIGYAVPGKECLYNILIMEEQQDIIACGAGTTTKYVSEDLTHIVRAENVKSLDHYLNRVDEMIERKIRRKQEV